MGLFSADRIIIPSGGPATATPTNPTTAQPPVVVIQQQPDPGISTQNGKRYMSALLSSSYLAGKLVTATGQAHLLSGATDQQLLDDYRNGDVTSSLLTLYGITIPKGMTQIKQSPLIASPEFPRLEPVQAGSSVVFAGGSWTFTVPSGWAYSVDTSSPSVNPSATPLPGDTPQNVLFSVDAVRSTRVQRPDGGYDVTVYGEWTEVSRPNYPTIDVPAGMYNAVILATLYPTDNPPPSS